MQIYIQSQPDEETCGPTCLHAIYEYYQDPISLEQVIAEVEKVPSGGTISALLGQHALQRGYDVDMYAYNVSFFDPTWFVPEPISMPELAAKLTSQILYKEGVRFAHSSSAYIRFIELGGIIRSRDLTFGMLTEFLENNQPIITGLSSTYLYQMSREIFENGEVLHDDIKGFPCGHFVVLCGHDQVNKTVKVADPYLKNPLSHDNYYIVDKRRLINSIMLGVLTYDANLLIIKRKGLS